MVLTFLWSSDLKIKFCKFSAYSLEFQKFSSITRTICSQLLEQFFLTVGQKNFLNKIPLIFLGAHDYEASKRAHRLLQCNGQKSLFTPQELRRNPQQWDAHRCRFSGSGLLGLLSSYNMNRHEVETSLEHISEKG